MWLGIIVVLVALVLLAPMAFGAGLAVHSKCALTALGTESIWTPGVIVNSPPHGLAQGWANGSQFGGGFGTPILGDGSAGVLEVEMNWTVYRTGMVWVAGPGLRDSCLLPYSATAAMESGTPNSAWCLLQGVGSVSDVNLSTSTPVAGCPFLGTEQAAKFNDSFATQCVNRSALQGGCGALRFDNGASIWATFRTSVVGFPVKIPIPGQSAGSWMGVADPMNQTVLDSISGLGCWIYETAGTPTGAPLGPLTWGPFGSLTTQANNPICTFG